ncbi:MAG: hypothetical protein JXA71_11710 [Chitinispirillaceae bacterium]|nr:hypothetical protein [Chitinispirillaceae bacterium]
MPKLNRPHPGQNGSVLVGAIALIALMALMNAAFIQVTSGSLGRELTGIGNEKAFQAAESGIWIGARWLRSVNPALWQTLGNHHHPFGDYVSIDGMDVHIDIAVQVIAGVPVASINAEAYRDPSGNHLHNAATFQKRVRTADVRPQTYGTFCTFFNSYQSDFPFDPTKGINVWWGWSGRTFTGRFHMNDCYIKLNPNAEPGVGSSPVVFKNGLVSVATPTDPVVLADYQKNYTTMNGGQLGSFGNNFNSGVWANGWTANPPTINQLNQVFRDRYSSNFDQVAIPAAQMNATALLNNLSLPVSDKIELPASLDYGEEQDKYRPTLIFNGTSATYHYRSGSSRLSATYNDINGKIFCSHHNLNVYGTVQGRVTVASDPGKSILPCGNIVTSDYNPATGVIPASSPNMIGLVAGKHIRFNNQWKRYFAGDASSTMRNVSALTTSGTMHLSASLMAIGQTTITDPSTGATAVEKGSEYWDLGHAVMYSLNLYGNHILGAYRPVASGWHGISNGGCNGTQTFTHDRRMVTANLQPPGYPQLNTVNGLWMLRIKGWSEENLL